MTILENNSNIPEYIHRKTPYETYYYLKKLQDRIRSVEKVKNIDSSKLCLCLDTETYEGNHNLLLEVGWCIFNMDSENNDKNVEAKHYIVIENINKCNRRHVPNNKYKFNFDRSEIKPLEDIIKILQEDLKKVDYLLGHDISNDINKLSRLKSSKFSFNLEDFNIIDTQELYEGCFHEEKIGLKKGLIHFNINYRNLHNAGNNAYYTMRLLFAIINEFNINDPKHQNILSINIPDDDYSYEKYQERRKERIYQENYEKLQKKIKAREEKNSLENNDINDSSNNNDE